MRLILLILLLALIPASNASILVFVQSNSTSDYLSIYDNGVLNGNYTKQAPASLGYPSANLKKFVPHPSENSTFINCYANDLNTPCTTQQWNNVTYETTFSTAYTPNTYYFLFENKTPVINGSGWSGGSYEVSPMEVFDASNILPTTDSITPSHSSLFCRITPTDSWIDRTAVPAKYGCDKTNIIDISGIPANDLPSGGVSHRIAPSELAILVVKLNNYPSRTGGTIKYKLENLDLNKVLIKPEDFSFNVPNCGGNCAWSYWWYQTYIFFGRYSWEVDRPGNYRISAITSWGDLAYDFTVVDSSTGNINVSYIKKDLSSSKELYNNGSKIIANYDILVDFSTQTANKTNYKWKMELYSPNNELMYYIYPTIPVSTTQTIAMKSSVEFSPPAGHWLQSGMYTIKLWEIYIPSSTNKLLATHTVGVTDAVLPPAPGITPPDGDGGPGGQGNNSGPGYNSDIGIGTGVDLLGIFGKRAFWGFVLWLGVVWPSRDSKGIIIIAWMSAVFMALIGLFDPYKIYVIVLTTIIAAIMFKVGQYTTTGEN